MRKIGMFCLGAACCHTAFADLTYRVDAGLGYSDNIRRTPTAEVSENIATAGLDLGWKDKTRRLSADVDINGDYLHYRDGTFDDEFVGLGNGELTFGIVPDHFTWLVQDSFGQSQSDPFAPATPETRENINYFTTGPDLIARLGSGNSLRLFGRYSQTDYERSLFDSDRTGVGAAFARQLAAQTQIALQGSEEHIRFDDTPASDYDQSNAFARYSTRGARTDVAIEGGYSWLERDGGNSKTSGPVARLDVTREVSAASRVSVSLGTQFSDSSQALRGAVGQPVGGGTGVTSAPEPFENRFVDLSWNFTRNRTGFGLRASWNEDQYDREFDTQATQPDRNRWVYELTLSRRFTPNVTGTLIGSYTDEEFKTVPLLTSDELRIGGTLDWQFGRHTGVSLLVERYERNSSDVSTEYTENRGFLTLFYRVGEAQR